VCLVLFRDPWDSKITMRARSLIDPALRYCATSQQSIDRSEFSELIGSPALGPTHLDLCWTQQQPRLVFGRAATAWGKTLHIAVTARVQPPASDAETPLLPLAPEQQFRPLPLSEDGSRYVARGNGDSLPGIGHEDGRRRACFQSLCACRAVIVREPSTAQPIRRGWAPP